MLQNPNRDPKDSKTKGTSSSDPPRLTLASLPRSHPYSKNKTPSSALSSNKNKAQKTDKKLRIPSRYIFEDELREDAPKGVDVVRARFTHKKTEDQCSLRFAEIQVHCENISKEKLSAWKSLLQERYQAAIILRKMQGHTLWRKKLLKYADKNGKITSSKTPLKLQREIFGIQEPEPSELNPKRKNLTHYRDLTHEHAIAIDPKGSKNIDDIFYVRKNDDNSFTIKVSFVNGEWLTTHDELLKEYIERGGETLYS